MTTRLTRKQVREIDRRASAEFHIPGIVLMENASRAAADLVLRVIAKHKTIPEAVILCGGGNNGGDGLAIARHLHNHGHHVFIGLCADHRKYQGDALINWQIIRAMNLKTRDFTVAVLDFALIIDAVFGTGLADVPRTPFEVVAELVDRSKTPVLA